MDNQEQERSSNSQKDNIMQKITKEDLLNSGAHFGHVSSKTDPNFKDFDKYNPSISTKDLKNYVFALMDYENKKLNIHLKTNFNNYKNSKNIFYNINNINDLLTLDFILRDLKLKITDLWKEENLINLLMPLSIKIKFQHQNLKSLDELKIIFENKLSTKSTKEWVNQMEKERIPCGPIYNIKEAVENPQVEARNMIVKAYHKVIGDFKLAGNPIKMSSYKDEKTRGDIPDLDEHREKILKEFS